MNLLRRIRETIASWVVAFNKANGIRDVFLFGGLAMLGAGLWMLRPWLGLATAGAVLMLLGLGWIVRIPRVGR